MTCGTLVIHTASSACCLKALCVAVLRTNIVDYAITNTLSTPAVLCCAVLCCAVLCCAVLCCAFLPPLLPARCQTGTRCKPYSQRTKQCSSWYSAQHCLQL
jgi:hypothetical protein